MNAIDELSILLRISSDATTNDIEGRYKAIAKLLMNRCCIKRADKSFFIEEIEFYFYNKNHRDLITYPRNTQAMQWYLNAFGGIDLTFESGVCSYEDEKGKVHYCLDKEPAFGGILLRKLTCDGKTINYPMNCAYRMFDILSASAIPTDYPLLVECEDRSKKVTWRSRHNILNKRVDTPESKVEKIVRNNNICNEITSMMVKDFKDFVDKEYNCYTTE